MFLSILINGLNMLLCKFHCSFFSYGDCSEDGFNEIYTFYSSLKSLNFKSADQSQKKWMITLNQYVNFSKAIVLLIPLLENELHRISAWISPLLPRKVPNLPNQSSHDRDVFTFSHFVDEMETACSHGMGN